MKKILKKAGAWALLFMLSFTVFCQGNMEVKAVTPSSTDYNVLLNGSKIFIYNEKTIGSKIGTEYFMTYTVEDVTKKSTQQGIIGTDDPTRNFPYTDGGFMRFFKAKTTPVMLEEGSTYFIKFTVAKGGYQYQVTRATGDKLENIYFDTYVGDATDEMKHFGLWLAEGEGIQAELSNVRFYDAEGNDLGVCTNPATGGYVTKGAVKLKKASDVRQSYEVAIEDQCNIAISNLKASDSSKIFIEYKVASAEYEFSQNGVSMSDEPKSDYPHRYGFLKMFYYKEAQKELELLDVGAEYIIMIERGEESFNTIVQKTKNKQTSTSLIGTSTGTYKDDYLFASLWFGAGAPQRGTFKLENFKIYDENHNSLGVQCNVGAFIVNKGEIEDYAGCEAAYYCEEKNSFIALYKDKKIKFTENNQTIDGTYEVADNVMTALFSGEKEKYEYLFKRITDDEGNVYERLYTYQVHFVTGCDTEIPMQELSNKTGYVAKSPDEPVMEGYEFIGWHTSDGTEFDFNQVVTESVTLYAKWSGDEGITFLAKDTAFNGNYLYITAGTVVLIAGLVVGVTFVVRSMKNERSKKQ